MAISFFARRPYIDEKKNRLMGGSSMIRAEQIAEYLDAKLNPTNGYENDVCVYVKPDMKNDGSPAHQFSKNSYIDIIDYNEYIDWLRGDSKLSGIVASKYSYDLIKKFKLPNKIVFIPQQHCNFDNVKRTRKEINTVGVIGAPRTFQYPIDELSKKLEGVGMRLVVNSNFKTREEIVEFYKNIDIQIIWDKIYRLLKNPLKIINAASFGIPTVGHPHKGYREVDGYYIKALTVDQLVEEVVRLKDEMVYEEAIENLFSMADKYHISEVAEMYKKLEKQCI